MPHITELPKTPTLMTRAEIRRLLRADSTLFARWLRRGWIIKVGEIAAAPTQVGSRHQTVYAILDHTLERRAKARCERSRRPLGVQSLSDEARDELHRQLATRLEQHKLVAERALNANVTRTRLVPRRRAPRRTATQRREVLGDEELEALLDPSGTPGQPKPAELCWDESALQMTEETARELMVLVGFATDEEHQASAPSPFDAQSMPPPQAGFGPAVSTVDQPLGFLPAMQRQTLEHLLFTDAGQQGGSSGSGTDSAPASVATRGAAPAAPTASWPISSAPQNAGQQRLDPSARRPAHAERSRAAMNWYRSVWGFAALLVFATWGTALLLRTGDPHLTIKNIIWANLVVIVALLVVERRSD